MKRCQHHFWSCFPHFSASHSPLPFQVTKIGVKGTTAIIEALQSPNCLLQELELSGKRKQNDVDLIAATRLAAKRGPPVLSFQ